MDYFHNVKELLSQSLLNETVGSTGADQSTYRTNFFVGRGCFIYLFIFGQAVWHAGHQSPVSGSNPCRLHWELRVLTTGLPGKSSGQLLYVASIITLKSD